MPSANPDPGPVLPFHEEIKGNMVYKMQRYALTIFKEYTAWAAFHPILLRPYKQTMCFLSGLSKFGEGVFDVVIFQKFI